MPPKDFFQYWGAVPLGLSRMQEQKLVALRMMPGR